MFSMKVVSDFVVSTIHKIGSRLGSLFHQLHCCILKISFVHYFRNVFGYATAIGDSNEDIRILMKYFTIKKQWNQCTAVSSMLRFISSAYPPRPNWDANPGTIDSGSNALAITPGSERQDLNGLLNFELLD